MISWGYGAEIAARIGASSSTISTPRSAASAPPKTPSSPTSPILEDVTAPKIAF
jgi:hypothetical protein